VWQPVIEARRGVIGEEVDPLTTGKRNCRLDERGADPFPGRWVATATAARYAWISPSLSNCAKPTTPS
jgi:hypothetical protein